MVGMKITQAVSLDTRIGGLEARTYKIERIVDQLCHSVPGFKSPLTVGGSSRGESSQIGAGSATHPGFVYTSAVPPTIPAIYQTHPADLKGTSRMSSARHSIETDTHSQVSFGDAPTYIGSLHPPSSSATQTQSLTVTAPAVSGPLDRPASTSTVRGATSLPSLGRDASEAGAVRGTDNYSNLLSQLEAERAARQALEAQVKKLSERLNALSTTMFAMVGGPGKSRSYERLAPPLPDLAKAPLPASKHGLKTLSVFETPEGYGDDGGEHKKAMGEEDYDDEFQTPQEDRAPQVYGAFGEELQADDDAPGDDEDDPKRKKAARTLSLSQLTLKRGLGTGYEMSRPGFIPPDAKIDKRR